MLYVGIDWADDHHDVCVTDDTATTLAQFQISHSAEGFASLHTEIARHQSDPSQVLVALETSRGLLVYDLLCQGYQVYAINPKAVNRYKDRHVLSAAKDDRLDALAQAHLLRTDRHRFKPLVPAPEHYRLLDRMCLDLRKLIEEKTRLSNQITSCLKEYYPQAVGLFRDVASPISLAFLQTFPAPDTVQQTDRDDFAAFFRTQRYTHPQRVEALYERTHARMPEADPVVVEAAELRLAALVAQLAVVLAHQGTYERAIKALLEELPEAQPVATLPGVDKRLVPELVAALGPHRPEQPKRFESALDLMKFSGCAPITRSSGKRHRVLRRRACDKHLRRTFYDWAMSSLSWSSWARAYYDHRKAQQHAHATILRGLGQKWAKILYALWSSGGTYDEAYHIEQLKRHQVVWAQNL
jgi:transposase